MDESLLLGLLVGKFSDYGTSYLQYLSEIILSTLPHADNDLNMKLAMSIIDIRVQLKLTQIRLLGFLLGARADCFLGCRHVAGFVLFLSF